MSQPISDQLVALDRIMYLLEENSFASLSENNEEFARFVDEIYKRVEKKASKLAERTTA